MNHLIPRLELQRVENSLLERKTALMNATSMTMNVVLLCFVLAGFGFFLYTQYQTVQSEPEEKRIPFTPTTWYSATRNVRAEEYGRDIPAFETEIGYGIP